MTLKQLIVFFVWLPAAAAADWYMKPSAGVGFTDNANYEDGGEDSDFFLFLEPVSKTPQ